MALLFSLLRSKIWREIPAKNLVKMAFWLQETSVVFWGCSENIWSRLLNMVSRGVPIGGVWGGVTPPHSSVLSAKFAAVGKFKGRGNEKGKKVKKEKRKKREKEKKERKRKEGKKGREKKEKKERKKKREKRKRKNLRKRKGKGKKKWEKIEKGYVTGKLK